MSVESTSGHGASKAAKRGLGLVGAGVGVAGLCFALGFSLTTAMARGTNEDAQAAELVSAQALAAGSDSVRKAWIEGFVFSPGRVKVSPGTTVLWTNRDGVDHDVTFRERDLASPLVGEGGKIAVVFRKPGEYRYYCHVHPFMQGTVLVN
jgi:plastocyanin